MNLNQDHVILDLKATDRFSAYAEIMQYLVSIGDVPAEAEAPLMARLSQREELTTFAMGKNIALPHINGTSLPRCVFVYARSSEGIEFGSIDTGLVHHVLLALISEKEKGGWLKTLARSAKALSNSSLRQQLMQAQSPQSACSLIQEYFA